MEKWEIMKREEMLEELSKIGVETTVEKQYSVGFQNLKITIRTTPEGYDLAEEFIDLELMRMAMALPVDAINELNGKFDGKKQGGNNFAPKKQFTPKPQYNNAPKQQYAPKQQQQNQFKPQGAQGSDKQWKVILDDRNRDKLINAGYMNPDGSLNFDISDFNVVSQVVSAAYGN